MTESITITLLEAKTILKRCQHSVSRDELRYYLNGVYFDVIKGNLFAVTTNGHMLTRHKVEVQDGEFKAPVLLGQEFFDIIKKIKASAKEVGMPYNQVKIELDRKACTFSITDHEKLTTSGGKFIDGVFPDYKKVMPKFAKNKKAATKFNASYLKQLAAAAMTDAYGNPLQIYIKDSSSPMVLKRDGEETEYILMPMR